MQAGSIILYQWNVPPDSLPRFRTAWAETTDRLKDEGALGSLLGQAQDGTVWAIARWPDAARRAAVEARYIDTADWPVVTRLQTVSLDVMDDRWVV